MLSLHGPASFSSNPYPWPWSPSNFICQDKQLVGVQAYVCQLDLFKKYCIKMLFTLIAEGFSCVRCLNFHARGQTLILLTLVPALLPPELPLPRCPAQPSPSSSAP